MSEPNEPTVRVLRFGIETDVPESLHHCRVGAQWNEQAGAVDVAIRYRCLNWQTPPGFRGTVPVADREDLRVDIHTGVSCFGDVEYWGGGVDYSDVFLSTDLELQRADGALVLTRLDTPAVSAYAHKRWKAQPPLGGLGWKHSVEGSTGAIFDHDLAFILTPAEGADAFVRSLLGEWSDPSSPPDVSRHLLVTPSRDYGAFSDWVVIHSYEENEVGPQSPRFAVSLQEIADGLNRKTQAGEITLHGLPLEERWASWRDRKDAGSHEGARFTVSGTVSEVGFVASAIHDRGTRFLLTNKERASRSPTLDIRISEDGQRKYDTLRAQTRTA